MMTCTLCGKELKPKYGKAPAYVSISINGTPEQFYCGSPSGSAGLSCWQDAIEEWHRLIRYDKTVPLPSERVTRSDVGQSAALPTN